MESIERQRSEFRGQERRLRSLGVGQSRGGQVVVLSIRCFEGYSGQASEYTIRQASENVRPRCSAIRFVVSTVSRGEIPFNEPWVIEYLSSLESFQRSSIWENRKAPTYPFAIPIFRDKEIGRRLVDWCGVRPARTAMPSGQSGRRSQPASPASGLKSIHSVGIVNGTCP